MLVSFSSATKRLEVSKHVFRDLVKEGRFTVYANPRDHRSKVVDTKELDTYLDPRVIRERCTKPNVDGTRHRLGSM